MDKLLHQLCRPKFPGDRVVHCDLLYLFDKYNQVQMYPWQPGYIALQNNLFFHLKKEVEEHESLHNVTKYYNLQ